MLTQVLTEGVHRHAQLGFGLSNKCSLPAEVSLGERSPGLLSAVSLTWCPEPLDGTDPCCCLK